MLKDIIFYPLILCISAAMIFGALSLGGDNQLNPEDIIRDGYQLAGDDLKYFTAGPGLDYQFFPQSDFDPAFIRMKSNIARALAPPSQGVFTTLSETYIPIFSGQTLRLRITARATADNALDEFDMTYFSKSLGYSGWSRKKLTQEWSDYSVEFKAKSSKGDADVSYFAIWPGDTAEPFSMDVSHMRIQVLEPH